MKKIIAFLLLASTTASAVPLQTWPDWVATAPYIAKQVPPNAMIVRGTGTDSYYVLEVNPTTGEIPVSIATGITIDYSGPTGSAVPANAAFVAGRDSGGLLRGLTTDTTGALLPKIVGSNNEVFRQGSGSTVTSSMNVHVGGIENVGNNYGATTTSLRTASQIGNATGSADFGAGNSSAQTLRTVIATDQAAIPVTAASLPLPTGAATEAKQDSAITISTNIDNKLGTLGQKTMAGSAPVVIASDQSDLPVAISAASTISVENLPATVAVDAGSHTASTIRVTEGSRSYSESALLDYSLSPVTTGAWVQVDASTAGAINLLCLTDQSGQVMELGSGAAASETIIFLIAPGFSGCIPLRIAAGVRLSVRAVSDTASSGYLIISGML